MLQAPNGSLRLPIWILFIGALISHKSTERSWFIIELARSCASVGVTGQDGLRVVLGAFFHPHFPFLENLREIWEETEMVAGALGIDGFDTMVGY